MMTFIFTLGIAVGFAGIVAIIFGEYFMGVVLCIAAVLTLRSLYRA